MNGAAAIRWIERHCVIPKGPRVGQPVRLLPFQKDILRDIYDTPTRTCIVSFGRQNAKTCLAAYIVLMHLAGPPHERNSLIVSTAQTKEQAAILFDTAAKIVALSPVLAAKVQCIDHLKQIHCRELGTLYRALSSDAPSQLGLSPVLAIHDELGQVRGPFSALYDAVESGTGVQASPLSIIISTQAANDDDLLSRLIDDAASGADPRVKLHLWTAGPDLDTFSEEAIRAANPAYDHFQNQEEVKAQAATASRLPSMQSSYENLILNRRIEAGGKFISKEIWKENGAAPAPLDGQVVFGGLDLSSAHDLTSLVLASDKGDVYTYAWLPQEGIEEKSRADRTPWDEWAKRGQLLLCPGNAIDYDHVAQFMKTIFAKAKVQAIGFDRAYMKFLRPALTRAGFNQADNDKFIDFGQGFMSMGPAIRELESRLLQRRLRHGNHPVLTACADNAKIDVDPTGSKKFTKKRSTGRIDALVSLAMAVAVEAHMPKKPQVTERSLMIFGGRQ